MVIFRVVPSAGHQFGPVHTARILANEPWVSLIVDFELDDEFGGRGLRLSGVGVWWVLKYPNWLQDLLG